MRLHRPSPMSLPVLALAAFIHITGSVTINAQETPMPTIKRTDIIRSAVSDSPGKEIIVQLVEFPPGVHSPRHFHNGEEVFYVLEGGTVEVPGRGALKREAGVYGINQREVPHAGYTVTGDKIIKILSVYVVDKDKDLQVPSNSE